MRYFIPPLDWFACLLVIGSVALCPILGNVMTSVAPNPRAGQGNRHRAPGLPRMSRSRTAPRRRLARV